VGERGKRAAALKKAKTAGGQNYKKIGITFQKGLISIGGPGWAKKYFKGNGS